MQSQKLEWEFIKSSFWLSWKASFQLNGESFSKSSSGMVLQQSKHTPAKPTHINRQRITPCTTPRVYLTSIVDTTNTIKVNKLFKSLYIVTLNFSFRWGDDTEQSKMNLLHRPKRTHLFYLFRLILYPVIRFVLHCLHFVTL